MTSLQKPAFLLIVLFSAELSIAQNYQEDVKSIESIMTALTDVISGSANEERDWEKFQLVASEKNDCLMKLNKKNTIC